MTSASVTIAELESQTFFEALARDLPISDGVHVESYALTSPPWPPAGHVALPGVVRSPQVARMAAAIDALVARGVPPVFAFVYDAFWEPAAALVAYVEKVLGPCRVLNDGWAWRVPAGPENGGWSPHRDWHVRTDPMLTAWVALTATDVDNACMNVVPLDRDPAYAEDRLDDISIPEGAGVALPVEAGAAIVWDAHMLHWGGRSSARARNPRISFSYTFVAAKTLGDTAVDFSRFPFTSRLDAIAGMIDRYEHRERMPPPIDSWAKMILGAHALMRRRQG